MWYERLFPKQREAVEAFISGRDVFVCLPAGGYIRKELLLWLPSHHLRLFEGSNLLDCRCCDAACGHHEGKSPEERPNSGLYYWTQQRCYLLLNCAALSGHGLLPHRHTLGTEPTLLHDPMAHTQVLHTAIDNIYRLVTHHTTRACKH